MCTAISFLTKDHYFGRNLDLEYHYQEAVTYTPRNYLFRFRNGTLLSRHYAMIGMATLSKNYPLLRGYQRKGAEFGGAEFPGERGISAKRAP